MIDDFKAPERPAPPAGPYQPTTETNKQQTDSDSFQTPDEVAADQTLTAASGATANSGAANDVTSGTTEQGSGKGGWRQNWRQKLKLSWPPGKKEYIVAVVVLVLIGGGTTVAMALHHDKPQPVVQKVVKKPKPVPKPTTVASNLSGLPVDPAVNARPVVGVMIENSLDARPQSGLGQASVVYEAIAEGGITRFLALFQDTDPGDVGPIRSARPYYVQWAAGFDAAYAHVGGSPEALNDIKAWGVRDLDQFANGGSYHRISSRIAPHNVYTGIATLRQLAIDKGFTSSTFTGFTRKKAAPAKVPTAKTIDIKLSGPLYNVHYDYNAPTNSYNRSEGGVGQIDANGNATISPAVVVALDMPYGLKSDGQHSDYQTIGSGTAYVFQDGTQTVGKWTKNSDKGPLVLTTADGKPLNLNPGQTWLTAVSAGALTSVP